MTDQTKSDTITLRRDALPEMVRESPPSPEVEQERHRCCWRPGRDIADWHRVEELSRQITTDESHGDGWVALREIQDIARRQCDGRSGAGRGGEGVTPEQIAERILDEVIVPFGGGHPSGASYIWAIAAILRSVTPASAPPAVDAQALAEVLDSLAAALSTNPGDQSIDHRDAWIFGILLGWDEALDGVASRHRWDEETVARLKRYRAIIERATGRRS